MDTPRSPAGERATRIGLWTTTTLLTMILLTELLGWLSLRAGVGMKVGVGGLFWGLVVIATLGSLSFVSLVRGLVRRRFRFGLKEFLIGTLLGGVGLGWLVNLLEPTKDQRLIAARLTGLGAEVKYGGRDEPGLESLVGKQYFHGVTALYGHASPTTDRDLVALEGLPDLEILTLGGPQITDAGLSHLNRLSRLRELSLLKAKVTGSGLAHLKGLTHLEKLSLYNCPIMDASLAHLKEIPTLRTLNLNQSPVSDAGLAYVGELVVLENLYLDRTGVTDAGLKHLTGLGNLRVLHLARTPITDQGLEHLRTLSKLRRLRLEGSPVSDEGVRKLRQERPDMVISK